MSLFKLLAWLLNTWFRTFLSIQYLISCQMFFVTVECYLLDIELFCWVNSEYLLALYSQLDVVSSVPEVSTTSASYISSLLLWLGNSRWVCRWYTMYLNVFWHLWVKNTGTSLSDVKNQVLRLLIELVCWLISFLWVSAPWCLQS